jgi:hypothetical protein
MMDYKVQNKGRFKWAELYDETKDAGIVCNPCCISRPTLRKWCQRFQKCGQSGLNEPSCHPKSSTNRKIFENEINCVTEFSTRRLGFQRFQSELVRNHDFRAYRATLPKSLRQPNIQRHW